MSSQEQFLNVIDRDEAEARFRGALQLDPLGVETINLRDSLGRTLAADVLSGVDVPSFDRSNFDGFAVRATDTFGSTELTPRTLRLRDEVIDAGTLADMELSQGEAVAIATGGMIPRGADAVIMIEHTDTGTEADQSFERKIIARKAVTPGHGVSYAGTDIATGEVVLRVGTLLTSRETGVLAAIGEPRVTVWRQPRVAIISTGNELISPGELMQPSLVFDSNAQILADSVRELGGYPSLLGIVRDDAAALRETLRTALADADVVLLAGGTSKGQGDLCYRVVAELNDPGIVAHGVALKPGKPICLAASRGKPVVILPGFPTSAIFTFHEFVSPVICSLAGRRAETHQPMAAKMAVKVNSEIGRTEYLLVNLIRAPAGLVAYPMGKGSGSVTAFSRADGFVTIGRHTELLNVGQSVEVRPLGRGIEPADLVVIGSHCVGLDYLLSELQRGGLTSKLINVGSSAGLEAAKRGECDLAGVHLLDAKTGQYNRPFLTDEMLMIEGYGRRQGIIHRPHDPRFEGRSIDEIRQIVTSDADCVMVNRNQGSGTRILIDQWLDRARPRGYSVQATNHNAVAAAVRQGRADWGLAIESVARSNNLGFIHYQDERYDFVVPQARYEQPALVAFRKLLGEPHVREHLNNLGFAVSDSSAPEKR